MLGVGCRLCFGFVSSWPVNDSFGRPDRDASPMAVTTCSAGVMGVIDIFNDIIGRIGLFI